MKKLILIAALAPVVALAALPVLAEALSSPAATSEARWFGDFDAAVAVAKAEGKDLFVDFSGSDWCHYCIKLKEEVLSHDEWIDAISKDYVLVELDFPKGDEAKALVPNPKRNSELQQQLDVGGYPTIFLMTADEVVFAKTGYQPGGPEVYVQHMTEIAAAGKKAMAPTLLAAEAFTAAEGVEAQWAAWDNVIAVFNDLDVDSPFAGVLEKHVRWGFDTDSDNAAGKQSVAAKALLTKGLVDPTILNYARLNDPKNEQGLLELLVNVQFGSVRDDAAALAAVAALENINTLGFDSKDLGFMLNLTAARWFNGPLLDADKKAVFAKKAMEFGSDDVELMAALKKLMG